MPSNRRPTEVSRETRETLARRCKQRALTRLAREFPEDYERLVNRERKAVDLERLYTARPGRSPANETSFV
jgi:hypothetical protein